MIILSSTLKVNGDACGLWREELKDINVTIRATLEVSMENMDVMKKNDM